MSNDDVEIVGVTMVMVARSGDGHGDRPETDPGADPPSQLAALLARYVVLTRGAPGCRTVDLYRSALDPSRFVVVQKWDGPEAQRAHFDSEVMVSFARDAVTLLERTPDIDLLDAISAHDLR